MSSASHELSAAAPPPAPEPELVTQDPNESITPPTPARLSAARISIALSVVFTIAALVLIFYRSLAVVEPISAVVVIGDPSFDGAEIVVNPDVLSAESTEWHATLSADNNFQTPVLLRPGEYWITITLKGQLVLRQKFPVEAYRRREYLLGEPAKNRLKNLPATRPASAG